MTPTVIDLTALPAVLTRRHLCALYGISAKTLQRRIRARWFTVPSIPGLPNRWARETVLRHLQGSSSLRRIA